VVALYITELAGAGRGVRTISRQLAAINAAHRRADLAKPDSAELRSVWAGIKKTHGAPPRQKRALITADLRKVLKRLPATLAGQRDRALLLILFAGAMRRSELAALELDDGKSLCGPYRARFVAGGLEIRLDRSKTDQAGEGQVIAIPYGATRDCPIGALRAWLDAAAIAAGPVFRAIDRHGRVASRAMSDRSVALIVKSSVKRAGFNPDQFSGHSGRAGFVTSAHLGGASLELIMRQTRHRKTETVLGYIRDTERFKHNAARKVGL
jgi:integrase